MATYYVELGGGTISPSVNMMGGEISPVVQFSGGDIYPGGGGGGGANLTTASVSYTPTTSVITDTLTPPTGYDGFSQVDVTVDAVSSSLEPKLVNFIDYDGTLLYSFDDDEFAELTALPANPTHPEMGLVPDGWNWTLAEIQAQLTAMPEQKVWIGQLYHTTSGATEIDIKLEDPNRLSFYIATQQNGTISINWGDGSASDTATGTSLGSTTYRPHTYSALGSYTIKITPSNGTSYIYCGISHSGTVITDTYTAQISDILRAIRLGGGLGGISQYLGCYASNLEYVTVPKMNESITTTSRTFFRGGLKSLTLPYGVTSLGANFLCYCPNIISISLPYGITSMANTGSYCPALKHITIPSTVTSITTPFREDASLEEAYVPSGITSLPTYSFSNCYSLKKVSIPSTVLSFGTDMFSNCRTLKKVTLNGVSSAFGSYFYSNCVSLQEIVLNGSTSNITSIGTYALQNCYALQNITIPSTVTSIGNAAFSQCFSLKKITIPASVTSIGPSAFGSTNSLSELRFEGTTPPTAASANTFTGISTLCKIYVPSGTLNAYTSAQYYPNPSTYTYIEY